MDCKPPEGAQCRRALPISMQPLLPKVATGEDFQRIRMNPVDSWVSAIYPIARRHGLHVKEVARFPAGENPVFDLDGRFVLKLVPKLWAQVIDREVECLEFLGKHRTFPAAALVGRGSAEDWVYMISARLPGRPLPEVWGTMSAHAREQIAARFGAVLESLHRLPLNGFKPGGPPWPEFVAARIAAWMGRPEVANLAPALRDTGEAFIRGSGIDSDPSAFTLLHGDLAPENLLVAETDSGWVCSGVFDFGNAMAGPASYDFAASTVLLDPGNRTILERFFEGYGLQAASIAGSRRLIMAYSLMHPLGNVPKLLGLIPGAGEMSSWDEVARAFWPD